MAHLCVEICSLVFPKSVTAAGFVVYQAHIDTPPNKGDRPTLNRSRLASEERIQRLRLISSKVPSEENIVVCKGTCQYQKKGGKRKKWSFHGTTLVILANPRQVNSLLHPDTLEYVFSADARTLQNTRRTERPC
jgi:hypothetical protein